MKRAIKYLTVSIMLVLVTTSFMPVFAGGYSASLDGVAATDSGEKTGTGSGKPGPVSPV